MFNSADQNDLWHHLKLAANEDYVLDPDFSLKDAMDTWTLQMGYPLVTLQRFDNGTSTIKQVINIVIIVFF